jgi:hypothetical protein
MGYGLIVEHFGQQLGQPEPDNDLLANFLRQASCTLQLG